MVLRITDTILLIITIMILIGSSIYGINRSGLSRTAIGIYTIAILAQVMAIQLIWR